MEKQNQATSHSKGISFFDYIKIIIINILISCGVLFVYHKKFATPEIAIVDLSGYIAGLRNLYLQGKIDDSEAKKKLDEAVSIIQNEAKKKVILSSEVVFGKNNRVKVIALPQLPPEAYKFDINEYLKKLSSQGSKKE